MPPQLQYFDVSSSLLRDLRRGVRFSPAQLTWQLCSAASHDKSGDVVAALLAAHASPNAVSDHCPPLMWAMMSNLY
jgi:hypothetical protein